MKHLILLFALALAGGSALAQGTAFTYQGRLNDGANPADGSYDLRFAIFNDGSAGTQQGVTLTNSATGVSNGLFTVTLDFGNQFPGADRWLEIAVRTNGTGVFTVLAPRQKISAAPYAITAGNMTGTLAAGQLSGTISPANIGVASITSTMLATGSVTSAQLATGAVNLQNLNTVPVSLFSTTVLNPFPITTEIFGSAITALGTDRFILGNEFDKFTGVPTGVAYLFKTNGTLLATFHDPPLVNGDRFGHAVAAVGTDKLLVGAYGTVTAFISAGAAYLFNTNGTLLITFTNPTPANNDKFGFAVAAVGADKVIISAYNDFNAPNGGGSAYLFSTNGTLLTTFNNHPSFGGESFGYAVAAIGTDKVAIGAIGDSTGAALAGAVFLFSTNGTLLTTITNPAPFPSDNFGYSLAVIGSDKLLVGAPLKDGLVTDAGAAYLFSTNGTLLMTYTNPVSPSGTRFGESVAAFGTDKVIIGATGDDAHGAFSGAAFLFDLNGALAATFQKPSAVAGDALGLAVAAIGVNQVIASAPNDDTSGTDVGAAYIFSMVPSMPGLVSTAAADRAIGDNALSSNVALRAGGNIFSGNQLFSFSGNQLCLGGNVGINTTNPTAKLDVNGSFRVGSGTTIFNNLQAGLAQMATGSPTVKTNFTFTFPKAFGSVPNVIVSARSGNVVPVDDTFAVTVRDVTTTTCTVNIVRVDNPSGWSQQVKINWLAWE